METFGIEYLRQLKNYFQQALTVGQLVLVGTDNIKCIEWPMDKILQLNLREDNNTLLLRVKTVNGDLLRLYKELYYPQMNYKEFSHCPKSDKTFPDFTKLPDRLN